MEAIIIETLISGKRTLDSTMQKKRDVRREIEMKTNLVIKPPQVFLLHASAESLISLMRSSSCVFCRQPTLTFSKSLNQCNRLTI